MSESTNELEEAVALAVRLPPLAKVRLIERVVSTLEHELALAIAAEVAARPRASDTSIVSGEDRAVTSLLALKGLGKEIWRDQDAQEYVDSLRDEWE